MEKDKPWALMSEKGLKQGFLEGNWHNEATLSNRLQQQRVPSKRPATRPKNPGHVRVGRLPCSWSIQYSVLSLLFSLKVVANGGLGIDHLGGLKVTHTPGAVSCAITVIATGLLLAPAQKTSDCRMERCPNAPNWSLLRPSHEAVRLNHHILITSLAEDSERCIQILR